MAYEQNNLDEMNFAGSGKVLSIALYLIYLFIIFFFFFAFCRFLWAAKFFLTICMTSVVSYIFLKIFRQEIGAQLPK